MQGASHQMEREELAVILSETTMFTSALPLSTRHWQSSRETHFTTHPCTQCLAKGKAEQKPPTAHPKRKERAAAPTREE